MTLSVLSIGTAVPPAAISQQDGLEVARRLCCYTDEHATWLPSMYGQTGIVSRNLCLGEQVVRDVIDGTRHSGSIFLPDGPEDHSGPTTGERMALYAETAPALALEAAGLALRNSGISANAITHLITVTCTGFFAPGLDVALIRGLGLPPTVQRTQVGYMGCHGAFNGLRVARAFTTADPKSRVMMCCTELCSLHYHYDWNPQKMIANAIFGDGSGAVIATGDRGAEGWRLEASGSCLLPNSLDAMTWTIADHGFEMTLAKSVPTLIATHLRPWLSQWLREHGLAIEEVQTWAVHPGGPRILTAVEEALGLPSDALAVSRSVLADHGNMSSPTILFILNRLQASRAPRPCVALGFGPGLTAEAALFV